MTRIDLCRCPVNGHPAHDPPAPCLFAEDVHTGSMYCVTHGYESHDERPCPPELVAQ